MASTHVQPFFRFRFELEDDEGTSIQVIVAEPTVRIYLYLRYGVFDSSFASCSGNTPPIY